MFYCTCGNGRKIDILELVFKSHEVTGDESVKIRHLLVEGSKSAFEQSARKHEALENFNRKQKKQKMRNFTVLQRFTAQFKK